MSWLHAENYWLARLVCQRSIAAIYAVGFLTAALQFRALLGSDGMLPIPAQLRRVPFRRSPSLFYAHYSDAFFAAAAWSGVAVSAALIFGAGDAVPLWASMLLWTLPWLLYLSIVNVGQLWYGFGWETLLCETGFYAIFLGSGRAAPPLVMLLALRWLLFRLEFGAGLIKMRGDRCWRQLTCLYYHHETQPMPNPLSWYFHHLPRPLHRVEVAANHATQLIVPFLLFTPAPVSTVAALIMIATQLWLIISGNFSWLNWLTVAIATSAVGDRVWRAVLPVTPPRPGPSPTWFDALVIAVAAVVVVLSYWPARNLASRRQLMNSSFNPLHLVNTYGAFGSISKIRHEVVIEGTSDPAPTDGSVWREYEFKGKPGDPRRRPPQVAPYHLRLDWLMWFVALSPSYGDRWLTGLLVRLLRNDRPTLKLLRVNPFADEPPAAVRALLYRYRFTTWRERRETGMWWHRDVVGELLPPVSLRGRLTSVRR